MNSLCLGLAKKRHQVVDVGVDVAVGQKPQEMKGPPFPAELRQLLPCGRLKNHAACNALSHQLGPLGVDLAAAKGIMPNL